MVAYEETLIICSSRANIMERQLEHLIVIVAELPLFDLSAKLGLLYQHLRAVVGKTWNPIGRN